MGILTTFSAWPAKWECCMLPFAWCLLPPHNILFLNPTGSKMGNAFDKLKTFTVNQTNKCVWKLVAGSRGRFKNCSQTMRKCARVTTVFRNTALQFFTNNFGILLLLFKLGKFAWKLFFGGFICWKTCDCASAGFGQVIKWESENKKQGKYRENGNSNKWEFRAAFPKTSN